MCSVSLIIKTRLKPAVDIGAMSRNQDKYKYSALWNVYLTFRSTLAYWLLQIHEHGIKASYALVSIRD